MAESKRARLIAMPDSSESVLRAITLELEARIHHIKKHDALVREKLAHQLKRARRANAGESHSIKYPLIAILDAIYSVFHLPEKRDQLIKKLNKLLNELSYQYRYVGFANGARNAFIAFFLHLLRKREKLAPGFLSWFERYVLEKQQTNVFGEKFDINEWKTEVSQRHVELLKMASIKLLEDYLTSIHVAVDRFKNATILLDNIKALPVAADSFAKFQRMLNISKQLALQADVQADASRFSFFRRHRFSSRYITLLDDLRERTLYCQNEQQRNDFKQGDDHHATCYLAEQVALKGEMIKITLNV